MNEVLLTADDIVRIKNFLICLWVGFLYAVCAAVIANVSWYTVLLIILLAGGSCYLQIGRRWLQAVAPVVLFVTLLGLMGMVPTGQDLRSLAHGDWPRLAARP